MKAFAYLILFSIYRIILVIRGGSGTGPEREEERGRERRGRALTEEGGRKGSRCWSPVKEEVYNKACRVQDTWWLAAVIKRVQRSSLSLSRWKLAVTWLVFPCLLKRVTNRSVQRGSPSRLRFAGFPSSPSNRTVESKNFSISRFFSFVSERSGCFILSKLMAN